MDHIKQIFQELKQLHENEGILTENDTRQFLATALIKTLEGLIDKSRPVNDYGDIGVWKEEIQDSIDDIRKEAGL
jgi:hypothetical protein